jgi:outer membrane receptor protein involved in Fe transport
LGDFVVSNEKIVSTGADQEAAFLSAAWDSGGAVGGLENATVTINASYRYNEDFYVLDRDKTNVAIDAIADAPFDSGKGQNFTTRNFEVIFNGDVNDRLQFSTGLFWYEEHSKTGQSQCWDVFEPNIEAISQGLVEIPCSARPGGLLFEFLPQAGTARGGPANAFQNVNVFTESTAVYGQFTYAFNDDWDLAFGARYTEDDRKFQIIEFDVGATCFFIGTHICQPEPVLSFESVFEKGFFNSDQASFSEVTPMISLTRNLAGGDTLDSGMIYGTISEGYLTGSFNDELNLFANPQLAPLVAYQPEHVTNYEVGFKGTFGGGRVRLAADVFWMDYTDKHEAIDIDNNDGRYGPDPNVEIVSNAGQVDIYGIEVERSTQGSRAHRQPG